MWGFLQADYLSDQTDSLFAQTQEEGGRHKKGFLYSLYNNIDVDWHNKPIDSFGNRVGDFCGVVVIYLGIFVIKW